MSFDFLEQTTSSSEPVMLYEFSYGTLNWFYNSSDRPITLAGRTYAPLAVSDDGIKQTGENEQDRITITVSTSSPVVALFDGTPPSDPVNVNIRLTNFGEMVYAGTLLNDTQILAMNAPLAWVGFILSVKRIDPSKAEILCETLAQTFEKNGLRLCWSRNCPYMLYDQSTCMAPKESFGVACTASTLSGDAVAAVALTTYPDGDFTNGFIEWVTEGGAYERRGIESSTAGTLTLIGLTDGLNTGQAFVAYPGCDRTVDRCNSRFSNLPNCGANPQMPGISPFDGTLLY